MPQIKTRLVRIVDTDRAWRESLRTQMTYQNLPVKLYADAKQFLLEDDFTRPGCIVLDLDTPAMTGMTLLSRLKKDGVELPVVMMGNNATITMAVDAMKMGARDFIAKPVNEKRVVKVVAEILKADEQDSEVTRFLDAYASLSKRERQVIEVSIRGLTHEEVAQKLGITIKTAQVHRYNAYRKLDHHNITEIYLMMQKTGLVEEG
ncbi:MAG: response regulator transcription factor [Burkholderiaceae bacterium]|nr:response regulator transcription factor [Burkholderiaceae bacterium]